MRVKTNRPGTIKDWLIVLAALLDEAAVLAVVLLVLWYFKIEITLPLIIVITVLFAGLVFLLHKAVIPYLHGRKVTGAEGMIGLIGKVAEPLTPVGVIMVGGECWKAKSVGEHVPANAEVEVVGIDGLTLRVRRKDG